MKKVLEMTFKKEDDKLTKVMIVNARGDLTPAEVKAAMLNIINESVFSIGGAGLSDIHSAKVITTQEEEFDLA
ncbi:DUF2922 domain-containing protein [Natronincola ferrireducens]|uniref:DUF2922 domain-containing protein n=1 Tax=Natronincola ferrireducens TaxID=393762 RepID=A0A1G8XKJ4_9FIRM|nr:DUF2922 domain-containing protein [Natronincola ferrireducens]SDJ90714.1 Protein of unknown function [Natronincola ferrireducens]